MLIFSLIVFQVFSVGPVQAQKKVKIGHQVWMTRNLNVEVFRNGDSVLEVKSQEEWIEAFNKNQPAWCYYNFDPSNDKKYGKLYNWYAVIDPRGLAPIGWHIPSRAEWDTLITFLGKSGKNEIERFEKAHDRLKSNFGWGQLQIGKKRSGFNAKPGGCFDPKTNLLPFGGMGGSGYWWSTTLVNYKVDWIQCPSAHVIMLAKRTWEFDRRWGATSRGTVWDNVPYNFGVSVRCIKD